MTLRPWWVHSSRQRLPRKCSAGYRICPNGLLRLTRNSCDLRLWATTRIEGAQFTPREEEEALSADDDARAALTHSQRQLRAASDTYAWMREQSAHRPVTADLILDIHRRIVTGCDDDHCEPGALRRSDNNVTFGNPQCRGAEGGAPVSAAFEQLCGAIAGEFRAMTASFRRWRLTITSARCTLSATAMAEQPGLSRRLCCARPASMKW